MKKVGNSMSVFCISDIHGNLDALKKLLKKVSFKYDGSDQLFFLGDYVDWGPKPIETLLYIKKLDEKYHFIHVMYGNHEWLMESYLDSCLIDEDHHLSFEFKENIDLLSWTTNKGNKSFSSFKKLSPEVQLDLYFYLKKLAKFKCVIIDDKRYYLTHSYPEETSYSKQDFELFNEARGIMVWKRVKANTNIMKDLNNYFKDYILVSGHTIVKAFNSMDDNNNLIVYFDLCNQYINIDTGAKLIGYGNNYGYQGRLSILNLNNLKVVYSS